MTEVAGLSSVLASLLHNPRVELFVVFSLCAVVPAAGVAWFWARERLRKRAGQHDR